MKGKTTRIGLVVLALLLAAGSFAGCGKNPSVLQLPEGTAAPDTRVQATPEPLKPIGNKTCRVGQETIPESTLFSFVLNAANFDPLQGLTLKLTSTNKSSNRDFVVSLNYLSVNGYMQDANYEVTVPAGKAVPGEILIPATNLRSAGVSSVDELILYPLIYDDTVPMGQGDVVDGAFSFYPTGQSAGKVAYPLRQTTSTEQTFFDNGFATCIVLDAKLDESQDLSVQHYLENKTDRFLSFVWSDVTVNNVPSSYAGDTIVAPGMRRYVTVPLTVSGLDTGYNDLTCKISATPLSNTGTPVSPLMEQRGTYRFTGASAGITSTGTEPGTDPGTDPGIDPEAAPTAEAVTPSPAPPPIIYTKPTTAHKRNAKHGYVNRDKVNMRSGPGTQYKTVGSKIDQNSTALLYELQDGWWFLKCNNKYGYVKADYVSQGKPKATPQPQPQTPSEEGDGSSFQGEVRVQTKAALRKSADSESKCLKELSAGAKVTVYYKTKGKDGHMWYYVASGKTKGYIRADLVKVVGKVPTK